MASDFLKPIPLILGFLAITLNTQAALLVTENYSSDTGWTAGFVQSTYSAMSGTYGGTGVGGSDATLYEAFTPTSNYDLVSVEFRYNITALGTTAPTLNFNLYEVATVTDPADPLVLIGAGLLNSGAGIDYTPAQLAASNQTHMAITFTDSDVYSLTSGTSYALAITASDVTFGMARRSGGGDIGGYGYKDLSPLNSSGRDLMLSTYDTALVAIPEPSTVALLLGGLGSLFLLRRRR
jgi:hypothetical protein